VRFDGPWAEVSVAITASAKTSGVIVKNPGIPRRTVGFVPKNTFW
jgi:hypothetical protein